MLLCLALFENFCFPQQVNEVWRRWMLDVLLPSLGSLGCLWIGFSECLHVGVVFFPSLPFMGVMLFPSSWLGNVSREWGLVRPSPSTPHSPFFFVPIFFSSSPFFSLFLSPLSSHFSSFSYMFELFETSEHPINARPICCLGIMRLYCGLMFY